MIEQLKSLLNTSEMTIVTDFRGLKVTQITELRRKLRSKKIRLQIIKNTLTRKAAEEVNKADINKLLVGPNALICASGDIREASKLLNDYIKTTKSTLNIKGGLLGNQLLTAEQVISLALLPDREVMLGRLLGTMQMPFVSLLYVLNGNLRNLMNILQARVNQLEKAA